MTHNSQGTTTARPKLDDVAFEAFIRARRPASPINERYRWLSHCSHHRPKFIDPRQWIPELTGPDALNLPMETAEHRAVQTIVAEYNRISASLSETPKDHRPKFTRIDNQTFDPFDWDLCFLPGTRYAFGSPSFEVMPSLAISLRQSANSAKQKDQLPTRMLLPSPKRSSKYEPTSCQSGQSRSSEESAIAIPSTSKAVGCSSRSR
jgi:hypothetical protein